jgi:hypothetical protein
VKVTTNAKLVIAAIGLVALTAPAMAKNRVQDSRGLKSARGQIEYIWPHHRYYHGPHRDHHMIGRHGGSGDSSPSE